MTPIIYFAQVSLYTFVMWGIYSIVWRNRPLHTYSRLYLLMSLVLPAILPLIHIPLSEHSAIAAYTVTLPGVNLASASTAHAGDVTTWANVFAWLYVAGCVLLAGMYLRAYIRINEKLSLGQSIKHKDYTLVTNTGIGPGTLGRRIFFPAHHVDTVIVRHELAHIQAGHRYDALLLQLAHIIFWMSPAHWLLGQELKAVHEFEADQSASKDMDSTEYASLLLSQSFGTSPSLLISHSFFCNPLKRRIMMLQKDKTPNRISLLMAALVLTTGFMSTVLMAKSNKAAYPPTTKAQIDASVALLDMNIVKRNTPPKAGEIKTLADGTVVFKTVEKMPKFDGSLREWLLKNMNISVFAAARAGNAKATVEFTVNENGRILRPQLLQTSGIPELDAEAMRAVQNMPPWKPGLHKGKPVPVIITLPIFYGSGDGC